MAGAFSPDGTKIIISGPSDTSIKIISIEDSKLINILSGHTVPVVILIHYLYLI